ncbi:MAG: aminoacyl-tRNA hydrolase [Planctomycetaceae bacterium]|nr:aminoacyl-tRNA hydrolase [Planctomycetaceae bacterium]MBP60843.1 aminoacyl-tRNA hydrolase [Planctomycetaceae bacterium]
MATVSHLVVNRQIRVPLEEFEFRYDRSSGPGGQNVNKVNSKVTLRWSVVNSTSLPEEVRARLLQKFGGRITKNGEIVVASQRYRDQPRNQEDCLEKVRKMLEQVATAPKRRKPTKPTRGSRERRLKDKRVRSDTKRGRRNTSLDGE